ncbi:hypothetical protein BKA93DRAFT_105453 [Sparassis latifolia]|uniref:Uncharacterized protein n=1 Tax=Sparassis crispa TaxID=139825 RepID=A0A401GRF5_9APHY|nr:hypothetical protein SCP_0607760 [Sparassis crispa]GBE84796.1 hypothetical protein SCP_0607760 [Sparassis crispa]
MLHTKGIYSLPLELRSHIVEYLINDHDSLRVLTFTCHAWRGVSQAHLFRRISVIARAWIHERRVSTLGGKLQNDWIYVILVLLPTRLTVLRTLTLTNVEDFAQYECTLPLGAFVEYVSLFKKFGQSLD